MSTSSTNGANRSSRASAEELHLGHLNPQPKPTDGMRLFVDLDICSGAQCRTCTVECSYFYHPENNGITSVRELAAYALICRRCEHPHCVDACPKQALEQQVERQRMLIRHAIRCVGCGSCVQACPYGTILPELVPYAVHNCDYCQDRRSPASPPLCVTTCPYGALQLRADDGAGEKNLFLIGDNLIVHSTHWKQEQA